MSQEDASTQDAPEAKPAEPKPESNTPEPTGEKVFDAAYIAELRKEAAKYRTEAQEAKGRLTEREEAEQSDLEKAQSKATKLEQAKTDAESKLLRYEVAEEKQVPVKARKYLSGATREQLEANADELIADFKESESKTDFDGGAREPAETPESPEDEHNKTILKTLGLLN